MISITLPAPPSLNGLFGNQRYTGGRHVSTKYEEWRTEAGWILKQARCKPILGKVSISLLVEDTGQRDLSNAGLKSIEDLLVTHGLIEGDDRRYVRSISLGWSAEVKGVAVSVTGVA